MRGRSRRPRGPGVPRAPSVALETAPQRAGMDGPGRAAEPCGADDGPSEPRWPQPPSEGADHPAEPRCETPLAGPQPTPTSLPTLLADRPESSQANVHREPSSPLSPPPLQAEEDAEPTRESCGGLQRPFPVSEDAALPEEQEDVSPGRDGQGFAVERPRSRLRSLAFQRLCCEHSRELYELIVERKTPEDACSLPGALSTDESVGSEANLLLSKEKEDWRYWENWGSGLCNEQQGALRAKGVVRNCKERDERRKTFALGTRSSYSLWSLLAALLPGCTRRWRGTSEISTASSFPNTIHEVSTTLLFSRQQKILVARELADQSLELTATRGRTPEPVVSAAEPEPEPRLKKEPEPESWPEEESEPELSPEEEPELEPQPEKAPEKEPQPEEEPELEPQPEEKPKKEPKPEPQPKKKPETEHKPKKEPRPKSEHRRKKEPRPKSQLEEDPMSRSALGYDFSLLGKKVEKAKLVQKYYKNGKKFLTMLPDGTSQLFYPSGNVAIIMTGDKDQHSLIVQEDELRTTKIRALFQSDGRSTCYYRNGDEWINMSTQGGQYLDQAGNRVRRWMWPNLSPEPHVPLSPIFISLNRHVGVRILAQDKIFVSFLAMGQQAKFNMGTRVQVSAGSQLPPAAQLGEDELLLLAFRVRILQLFDRMRGCLNFPSGEQWNKMQPPMYLINQAVKILELCMAADISDELRSSIKAIVNAQQL
ncbi:glutamate-rich protein 6 [Sylvia borin]